MPTNTAAPATGKDRIIDYLTDTEIDDKDVVSVWGLLGPQALQVTIYDRPKGLRTQDRRYLVRIDKPGGELDRTRVFQSEASVVWLLDAIERGVEYKREPRGVAAKRNSQRGRGKGQQLNGQPVPQAVTHKRAFHRKG